MALFGLSTQLLTSLQSHGQMVLSVGSFVVTAYFWVVRINREREALRVYQTGTFEGTLESGHIGAWAGRLMLANRSIMPTAIVEAKVELCWQGKWLLGCINLDETNQLPWNLPAQQVAAQKLVAGFDVGPETTPEQVYADQRLRFTFLTVEGRRVVKIVETNVSPMMV